MGSNHRVECCNALNGMQCTKRVFFFRQHVPPLPTDNVCDLTLHSIRVGHTHKDGYGLRSSRGRL